MRIVLVGGGTGGHFYPLVAISESLQQRAASFGNPPPELIYMGPDPYDKAMLDAYRIRFVRCPAGKRRRYRSLRNITDMLKTFYGVFVAVWKLFLLYPDVVMSKGGYTSVPIVTAAWLLRIPIVIHESDSVPGTANKYASRFARYIAISYPETAEYFPKTKTALTGIPIRAKLRTPASAGEIAALGLGSTPIVLVLGGSQGAERVNTLILDSLDELLPNYSVIHQTGDRHIAGVKESAKTLVTDRELLARYRPAAFFDADTLNAVMSAASIIVARAGSTTIYEIALHAKPAILIPIPEEVSHDQRTNAYAYARTGAAVVIEEENLEDSLLAAEIARIMNDTAMYNEAITAAKVFAKGNAAERVAEIVVGIGKEHESR